MTSNKKVEYLVVDTSAFIKNTSLQELGINILTVQDVVDEIVNKRQLRNLVVLPYDLKIKDVFSENIKLITDFSKKTGDYPSLSATDIQVMALTYQLEKEKVGTEHLKTEPQVNRIISYSKPTIENHKEVAGFYLPAQKKQPANGNASSEEEEVLDKDKKAEHQEDVRTTSLNEEAESERKTTIQIAEQKRLNERYNQHNESYSEDEYGEDSDDEEEDSDDFDGNGWITPSNIAQKKQEMQSDITDENPVIVACITSDFAMQNVLKQMGLNVVSVDGYLIHELRTFILRCYACFKTTSIMTKVFCPHCGNKTLKRVAVSLKEDGTQEIHISTRRPLTGRGKRFSLPKPQGGKHANNPLLCEDQRFPHQRPTRLGRIKNNPLDPDYIAGFSPFVMRDINSRAAMLGIHGPNVETKNWMRKNPNEVRRKGRKKKK